MNRQTTSTGTIVIACQARTVSRVKSKPDSLFSPVAVTKANCGSKRLDRREQPRHGTECRGTLRRNRPVWFFLLRAVGLFAERYSAHLSQVAATDGSGKARYGRKLVVGSRPCLVGFFAIGLLCFSAFPTAPVFGQVKGSGKAAGSGDVGALRATEYNVGWTEIRFNGKDQRKTEGTLDAIMVMAEGKHRFNVTAKGGGTTGLFLDARNFVTVPPATSPKGKSETTTTKKISADSPWIMAYPLLLTHGIVPFPPFDHRGLRPLPKNTTRSNAGSRRSSAGNQRLLRRSGIPYIVRVTTGPDGSVQRYEVVNKKDNHTILRIGVSYQRDTQAAVLDRCSIIWFSETGTLVRRVDAKARQFRKRVAIDLTALSPPLDPAKFRDALSRNLARAVKVEPTMSLEQLVAALKRALGDGVRIRLDDKAFSEPFEFKVGDITFDTETVTVEDLLFNTLQQRGVDFFFDGHGIAIVPTHVAWKHSRFSEYVAKDHAMTVPELRDTLYNAAPADDWSDVGGPSRNDRG